MATIRKTADLAKWEWQFSAAGYPESHPAGERAGVITMVGLYDHDPAEVLDTSEGIAGVLTDALESGDRALIAHTLGLAARAKGMTELARETGLSRSNLYDAFNDEGNPTLETTLKVLTSAWTPQPNRTVKQEPTESAIQRSGSRC